MASANPGPTASDRVDRSVAARVRAQVRQCGTAEAELWMSAGTSATVASSVRIRMPRRRAWIEASTRAPCDRCLRRSGSALSASGARVLTARGTPGAELLGSPGCFCHLAENLRITFTPRLGTGDVADRKERQSCELHESPVAPS